MCINLSPSLRLTKFYLLTALTLLIVQNFGLLLFIFIIRDNYGSSSALFFQIIFILDIAGFSLLGTGLLLYYFYKSSNIAKDSNIFIASIFFILWVLSTLFWRTYINFYTLQPYQLFNGDSLIAIVNTINTTILMAIAISAGALFLAIYFLDKSFGQEKVSYENIGIIYSGLNLFLFIPLFGLLLKITVVPVLGIVYYSLIMKLFYKLKNEETSNEISEKNLLAVYYKTLIGNLI